MQPFKIHKGLVCPIDRANIDTDAIIPKQFLKKVDRIGFGKHLFHEWRYLDYEGTKENPDFVLNQKRFRHSTVLLARDNFGCGSSREHAPWALADYGFKVIIAPSFADIFYNNCFKNGILPAILSSKDVDVLFQEVLKETGAQIAVDLPNQTVQSPSGQKLSFKIDAFNKDCLIKGLDSIGWTLQYEKEITSFETKQKKENLWLYSPIQK